MLQRNNEKALVIDCIDRLRKREDAKVTSRFGACVTGKRCCHCYELKGREVTWGRRQSYRRGDDEPYFKSL